MILDDLKDKLAEQWQATKSRLEESSAYIKLSEQYHNLSPNMQKATLIGGSLVFTLIVLSIPWSYISSSSTNLEDFENKKALIRELFRVRRASSELQDAPPAIDPGQLTSRAQNQLQTSHIMPEQIKAVQEYDNSGPTSSSIIPKTVIQKGVSVSLLKLNLRQVVDLGSALQNLERGIKMIGLHIEATDEDAHFYNAEYKLVSFSLPVEPTEKPKEKAGVKKGAK